MLQHPRASTINDQTRQCRAHSYASKNQSSTEDKGVTKLEVAASNKELMELMGDDDTDDSDHSLESLSNVKLIKLDEEQDKILREFATKIVKEYDGEDSAMNWYDDSNSWKKLKTNNPELFDQYTMGELRRAYFNLSPSILDVLTKTPVGPAIAINVIWMIKDWDFYQELFFGK